MRILNKFEFSKLTTLSDERRRVTNNNKTPTIASIKESFPVTGKRLFEAKLVMYINIIIKPPTKIKNRIIVSHVGFIIIFIE